jgi:hypothetical protein
MHDVDTKAKLTENTYSVALLVLFPKNLNSWSTTKSDFNAILNFGERKLSYGRFIRIF